MDLSYAHGASSVVLLGETIGENLARTAARVPDHEALVVPFQGVRLTYRQLDAAVDEVAKGLLGARAGQGRAHRHLEPEQRRVGAAAVRHGADRSDPRQPQPRLPHARGGLRAPAERVPDAGGGHRVQGIELRGHGGRGARRSCPHWRPSSGSARRTGTTCWRGRPTRQRRGAGRAGRRRSPSTTRSTSSTPAAPPAFPKGATLSHHNILNNGYFVGEGCAYTEADRVCIPVPFYHCFGMVLGNLACTTHGAAMVIPAPAFDPVATLQTVQDERCTSLYGVPTMFIAELSHPDFAALRPVVAADGDHGRLALPGRGDEAVHQRDAHGRGHDLLRHDRDVAGVDPDAASTIPIDKRVGSVGRVHPHVEVKVVDPATGLVAAQGRGRRAVHPRLLRDARLLERPGAHGRGDRRRPVDAHR